jgi:hypothetical protein
MALDVGEPQPSRVCGSEARVVAPDDGDGTDPVVGGDLADCVLGEAPLPVKTVSTSVMANNGGFFVLLRCCSSSPLDCFEETYLGLLDWTMGARRCSPSWDHHFGAGGGWRGLEVERRGFFRVEDDES